MDGSNEKHCQEVSTLHKELESWIQDKLKDNNSSTLHSCLQQCTQQLQSLENNADPTSPDNTHQKEILQSPYQLTPKHLTKVVHFIRHGHGYHNPPTYQNRLDARLTPLGWKQAFQLRQHLLHMKTPFEVELVVTSSMTRTLQTAAGVFGFEKPRDDSELLAAARKPDEDGPGHPAFYKSTHLPIIAQELCRECLQGNSCDTRRCKSELMKEFPGVDFSRVEYEDDLLSQNIKKEWGEAAKKRARSFIKWLLNRPQSYIAVVSHCGFLAFVLQECCSQLSGEVLLDSTECFKNCEMRTFVLSRTNYSTLKPSTSTTTFKPKQN